MFIFHAVQEDKLLTTYKDIVQSYADLQKRNAMTRDTLRKEAKDLFECYVSSLNLESRVIDTAQGKRGIVSVEQDRQNDRYVECSPLALDISPDNTMEFRISLIIATSPKGTTLIPAYIQFGLCEGMVKVVLSLSNSKSDRHAELYVSSGEGVDRYSEVAEYIKGMMMQFIADQSTRA
ncbi:hypothetical protein K1077_000147 [Salmonella enterica]|uniref:Uncharacterized protein n=2 Tax=Salmonella enterica TaxID=28901 RepID=A0A974KE28_SALET|nr:hypothetical protein LFZ16_07730 [Salmonella enterica subsp. enterica serovar India str. SA20085604]EAA7933136.1 hypothetical protein [Salmonella enterica subsp. enterica serovar Redlands]EBW8396052.1 hypothetical protein [Salmonella enterica subsp. enterica serovar Florida]ECC3916043.1 hypothetical protein [Salmonella enterica subsp. diarizonae]EGL4957899.1 hypothetical protein [Salmonella enterica]OSD65739.1 hypothetical protein R537_21920 [Salmonella enterica subsp. enterica serovar Roug